MMSRCWRETDLEVHHNKTDGGNGLDNAIVLCRFCNGKTASFMQSEKAMNGFSKAIKKKALKRAENRCQCKSDKGCH